MDESGIAGQISGIREQVHLLIERELRARRMTGVVPAHGAVLGFLLEQTEPMPIKAVVERVGRAKSTITEMLNTLQRHGYVRRSRSAEDGRGICVTLTAKGRRLEKDFDAISERMLARLYGPMPQKDRKALVRLLAALERNLGNTAKGT